MFCVYITLLCTIRNIYFFLSFLLQVIFTKLFLSCILLLKVIKVVANIAVAKFCNFACVWVKGVKIAGMRCSGDMIVVCLNLLCRREDLKSLKAQTINFYNWGLTNKNRREMMWLVLLFIQNKWSMLFFARGR